MGQDKARLSLGGLTLAGRLASLLSDLFEEVLLIGGDPPGDVPGRHVSDPPGPSCALRGLVGALPGAALAGLGQVIDHGGLQQLRANLDQLCQLVQLQPYLVGDRLSLADLAVAAQLSLLKFPASAGQPLAGRGVPGLADDPQLAPLWAWRDRIGLQVGRP